MKWMGVFLTLVLVIGCARVPITGRRQMNLLPESELMTMSLTNYKDFLSENKVVSSSGQAQMVKRVGKNIADAVTKYLNDHGMSKRIQGYKWEFNLVQDATVNAWCMPGGKVVVYTGLLPVTQSEEGLAVVMGHEIAHAIARHGNERMSQGLAIQAGGAAVSIAVQQKPQLTQNLFKQSYGIASQLGMLKYSRKHESEADKMGLIFMAMAGYNPDAAVSFWQRMKSQKGGAGVPEILSTHPHDDTRIEEIKKYLPTAREYYKK